MNFDPVSYIMGTKSGGHGSRPTLETLKVQENVVITAPDGVAWNKVEADVPNTYTAADEGKVVCSGALVEQGTETVRANAVYDTTKVRVMTVDVQTFGAADAGKVVKVVDGAAVLVAQGVATVGVNGPVDTTEIAELRIAVAPYQQPFVSPLRVKAGGPLTIEVSMKYNNLGAQISGAEFAFDGQTWSRPFKDGLGTFEVVADGEDPSVGIITVEPPSGGTVIRRAYSYVS